MGIRTLAADLVLASHFLFVAFVVVGLLLIVIGGLRRWQWTRGLRFRVIHLLAIGIVVAESWLSVPCPLTVLEQYLRDPVAANEERSFIAAWMHRLLFYSADEFTFTVIYTVFAAVVVLTWLAWPPRVSAD